MSTNALSPEKVDATDASDIEPIGIDEKGCTHFLLDGERIQVFDDNDEQCWEQELAADQTPADWIEHIADARGWAHRDLITARDLFGGW